MPVTLTPRERKALKGRAHALDPVVQIGHAGATPRLTAEARASLDALRERWTTIFSAAGRDA